MSIDYERTKNNILYFLKLKKEMKLEKPFVNMNYVLSDANDSKKIIEIKMFWLSHGINRFETSVVDKWWNDSESSSKYRTELRKNKKYPCPAIWNGLYFASDGRVALCCSRDYEVSYELGNIIVDSAEQILNNKLKDYFKYSHINGKFRNISICSDCEGLDKTYYSWWVY
jgi:radical SAM protein with 4Fe4S-binding SPASM domain